MTDPLTNELRGFAIQLADHAAEAELREVAEPLAAVESAVSLAAKAWSGSNMGYHSRVYYAGMAVPPPGAHFDSEWGFRGQFQGTTGDWQEYLFDDVISVIYETASVSLDEAINRAGRAHDAWTTLQPEIVSVLVAYLSRHTESLIERLRIDAEDAKDLTEAQAARALIGPIGGAIMIRDTTAFSQGFMAAPHQVVEARVIAIRSRFVACATLAGIAERAASHMERVAAAGNPGAATPADGDRVFIGHGGSTLWRDLKDFINEDLHLPWDEFNRVPVAGITTVDRLSEMLEHAGIAFLVLTAEDETVDGRDLARQNVVHEAGLFQARLGFRRAIVLLEEGCDEFSNIRGLTQIRFPAGNINAVFNDVRKVLEREGFVS